MYYHHLITKIANAFATVLMLGAMSATAWAMIAAGTNEATAIRLNTVSPEVDSTPIPLALSINPALLVGGNPATATITLSTPAPAGGIEITLQSLNAPVARFGGNFAAIGTSQLRIAAGSVSATFPVRTFGVANRTSVTLQALSLGETASATVTVIPASVKTLAIAPATVIGGASTTGTVTLDGVAPDSAEVTVQLSVGRRASGFGAPVDNLPAASVPASITVNPGSSSATFTVTTNPVRADTVVSILAGTSLQSPRLTNISDGSSNTIAFSETPPAPTALLIVSAPVPNSLIINPQSVAGGALATGTIVLNGKAPASGIGLALSTGSSDATVTASVSVPAGSDRVDFQITTHPVGTSRTVTINASALQQVGLSDGSVRNISPGGSGGNTNLGNVSANLALTPSLALTAQPSPATAGAPVAITLIVQPDTTASTPLSLTTDHPELLQVPATVAVPQTAALQKIILNAPTTASSTDQNVTVTAARGSINTSTILLIQRTPPPISSFALRPTTVHGGLNIIAQLTFASTAPPSVVVSLTTDHPELVTVPATITIAHFTIPSSLTFKTATATAQTVVTITASSGSQTTSATVSIVP